MLGNRSTTELPPASMSSQRLLNSQITNGPNIEQSCPPAQAGRHLPLTSCPQFILGPQLASHGLR